MKDRIIQIRKSSNLSQEKFASQLNLSRNFIGLVETGERNVSDRTISDICKTFNVNEEWLRTGSGEMYVPMTRNQRIMAMINDVLSDSDDSERKQFFDMLTQLDENDWLTIAKMAKIIKGQD